MMGFLAVWTLFHRPSRSLSPCVVVGFGEARTFPHPRLELVFALYYSVRCFISFHHGFICGCVSCPSPGSTEAALVTYSWFTFYDVTARWSPLTGAFERP